MAQQLKNQFSMQETGEKFPSFGWEDPLEKDIATHSNILAQEIPWTKEPGGYSTVGSQRGRHEAHEYYQRENGLDLKMILLNHLVSMLIMGSLNWKNNLRLKNKTVKCITLCENKYICQNLQI